MTAKNYLSPNGSLIIATVEIVPGTCGIVGIYPDGKPEYDGTGTDMDWDGQTTKERDGKPLFLDENGDEWTFDQLKPVPDEKTNDGIIREAIEQLRCRHTGPHAQGATVIDVESNGVGCTILGMGETWATVIYDDEPGTPCSVGNRPGRFVAA